MSNSYLMNTLTINNHQLPYTIHYQKKRKSIQLKLTSPHHLLITAPAEICSENIKKIAAQKSRWIEKQIEKLTVVAANPVNKRICQDSEILFLGHPHTLKFVLKDAAKPPVYLKDKEIILNILPLPNEDSARVSQILLKQWYIHSATEMLTAKTGFWSSIIKVHPRRISIKEQKTRWGSCSSKGNINYNWRIIMAPLEVIDYLVIHELCHLCIPNHSQKFWHEVEKYSPKYRQCQAWLRTNGILLMSAFSASQSNAP